MSRAAASYGAITREAEALRKRLGTVGQVLTPDEADEPILSETVRKAVYGWLAELNARSELAAMGVAPRSTALLSGPPGTGKTTLAHHLAARLGVPMVNVGAEHLMAKYLGESEQNVARLFQALTDYGKPVVLFLDEIDAIGGKRVADVGGGGATAARNSTLTVLLRHVERFEGVMVAATNRADTLDPALWRRFGMQLVLDVPDFDARWAILRRYSLPLDFPQAVLDELTMLTAGASPALLRQAMEGIKRLLVLAPRMRLEVSSLAAALRIVTGETVPHPDFTPPELWSAPERALSRLDAVASQHRWPPARHGDAA